MSEEINYTYCPYCSKGLYEILAPEGESRQQCAGCGHIFNYTGYADIHDLFADLADEWQQREDDERHLRENG